jgi:hypothetical protein
MQYSELTPLTLLAGAAEMTMTVVCCPLSGSFWLAVLLYARPHWLHLLHCGVLHMSTALCRDLLTRCI